MTGEEWGLIGASSIEGKVIQVGLTSVRVQELTNFGDTCKGPGTLEGSTGEGGRDRLRESFASGSC